MSSNIPPRRPRRGTALTAALAIAAIGGPFAATAVIIAEQHHVTSSTTSTTSTVRSRNPSGQPGVSAGGGQALTVSSGSTVQTTTNGGSGVSSGSGPAYTVSSGS